MPQEVHCYKPSPWSSEISLIFSKPKYRVFMVTSFILAGRNHDVCVEAIGKNWMCVKGQVSISNGSSGTNTRKKNSVHSIISYPVTTRSSHILLLCETGAQCYPESQSFQSPPTACILLGPFLQSNCVP